MNNREKAGEGDRSCWGEGLQFYIGCSEKMSFQQRLEGERCVLKMARGRAPRQSEQQVLALVWEPG